MIQSKQKLTARITSKENLKANLNNKVIKIYPELESLEVTSSIEKQVFKSDKYGYDKVTVNPIERENLNINPSLENQTFEGVYGTVKVNAIESEELNIVPSAEEQVKEGMYKKVTIIGDSNLVSENIKDGVTIFGTTGNYTSAEVVEKDRVKLFETKEEMKADTEAKIDDLAVVYKSELETLEVGQTYTELYLPRTITLSSAISSTTNIFFSTGTTMTATHFVRLTKTAIKFYRKSGFSGTVVNTVAYTSTDGITYTRTDSLAETLTVAEIYTVSGTTYYSSITVQETNANILQQMFSVPSKYFGGVYTYGEIIPDDIYCVPISSLTLGSDNKFTWDKTYNSDYAVPSDKFQKFIDKCVAYCEEDGRPSITGGTEFASIYQGKLTTLIYTQTSSSTRTTFLHSPVYDLARGRWWLSLDLKLSSIDPSTVTLLQYDEDTDSVIATPLEVVTTVKEDAAYIDIVPETILGYSGDIKGKGYYISTLSAGSYISSYYDNLGIDCKYHYLGYDNIPTQLDATSDYVLEKEFYGAKGLETGTLQSNTNLSFDGIANRVHLWNSFKELTPNEKNTDFSSILKGYTGTSIPSIDTRNVTNMTRMFDSNSNLKTIPPLNTSNVEYFGYMFYNCTSLEEAPALDTSSGKIMWYMFDGCSTLVTVPILDASNATQVDYMFRGCTALSDESLNNILAMCVSATTYADGGGTTTLKYIGLTEEQATKCTTLSNYSVFISAGWKTGY